MAITIAKAVAYIKNTDALSSLFKSASYTSELEKPCLFVGADTVKIQQIAFGSSEMGDFSKESGYTAKDYSISWVTKKLTQDKGDQIYIDKMDDEESQAGGIVTLHNKYVREVMTPSVDKYRFQAIAQAEGISSKEETLTAVNVVDSIIDAFTALTENQVNTDNLILYVSPAVNGLLQKANAAKGYLAMGNWGGNVDYQSQLFNKALLKVVPSTLLGTGVNFILLNPNAVSAQKKFMDITFIDKTEKYGSRRAIVDEGIYHDCYVQPNGEKGVYLSKVPAAA